MKKILKNRALFILVGGVLTGLVSAQIPQLINYQGLLFDPATGTAVLDDTYSITFAIYNASAGGSDIWHETHNLETKNGLYSVTLGSITPLTPDILSGTEKFLGIKVGADPEMTQRKRIVSVAYAILSEDAAKLEGRHAADFADADHNHDTRYYSKTELNVSDGDPPNQGSNRMSWDNLKDMPAGFADGVDNGGTGGDSDWTVSGENMYAGVPGNVGIGETTPERKLHIDSGMLRIDRDGDSAGILLHRYNGTTPLKTFLLGVNASAADDGYFFIGDNHEAVGGTADFRWVINKDGNVGIGTTAPASKLQVAGTIHSTSGGFKFPDGTTQTTAVTASTSGWNLTGNSGTTPGTHFIGTTDNNALELKVDNARALRLEPIEISPNLIGGYLGNTVSPGIYGATIGGGGQNGNVNNIGGNYSTVAGGEGNNANSDRAFVGGGQNNSATSSFTAVGGGWNNQAAGPYNIVGGGSNNAAHGQNVFIGGGSNNMIEATGGSIAGGEENSIIANHGSITGGLGNEVIAEFGTIAGGGRSEIYDPNTRNKVTDEYGAIAGGGNNLAGSDNDDHIDARYASVGGGLGNEARSYASIIAGGSNNIADSDSGWTTVSGGRSNNATGSNSTICGGRYNSVSGYAATVAGGSYNSAAGNHSFAAGQKAKANHRGSFVWADYSGGDFVSTTDNEFRIRASGGMFVRGDNAYYGASIDNQSGGGDGLRIYANVSQTNYWGALYAVNNGTSPAIYASGVNAAYLSGNVTVTGVLTKGGGSFKIDHPLDPENKYLYHSFVESPDMKNVYDGVVTLDAQGEAWIDLPDWFDSLNRDFRYQLTAIGAPAPGLFIAEEISYNRFKISGGSPGQKVSWQVTGIRQDNFANAHRVPVEEEKTGDERGKYLHPVEHGAPESMGIGYDTRQRKKEMFDEKP